MIARSGKNSVLTCSDMCNAYKCLPVCMKQRRLQVFSFLGREFCDLRLIFEDRAACMMFDKFHFCVLANFVLNKVSFPLNWIGRTIDDVTSVSPAGARSRAEGFETAYRHTLQSLNIGCAPNDPSRLKAFTCSTSGELLGVWFDTEKFTFQEES